jgi:hypothetical protein
MCVECVFIINTLPSKRSWLSNNDSTVLRRPFDSSLRTSCRAVSSPFDSASILAYDHVHIRIA